MNAEGKNTDPTQQAMRLLAGVAQQIAGCQQVLIAYSGGVDSSVLLHMLVEIARQRPSLRVRAAYVHHGLSPHADHWAQHCQNTCQQWGISCSVLSVTVDARKQGVEAAARAARYQALQTHLHPDETLLTAQHLDDQCETFLLALKRGSGPAGLSAMALQTCLGEHQIVRPLLDVSRAQLETYAHFHQLRWVEDESNFDHRYDRNFLRRQILPALTQRWPHFATAVARSAQLCAEQEQLLDELLAASLQAGCDNQGSLAIAGLLPVSEPHRFALLRRWLAEQGVSMPSRQQLQRLWQDVVLSRPDAEPVLQLGSFQIRRFRQRLYCIHTRDSVAGCCLPWSPEEAILTLPKGLGALSLAGQGTMIRAPREDEVVSVRFGWHGKIHIVGRNGGRSVKKIWQELGVAPWRRETTPLIFYNEQPITAVGVFVTREGNPGQGDRVWHVVWHEK